MSIKSLIYKVIGFKKNILMFCSPIHYFIFIVNKYVIYFFIYLQPIPELTL